jgi:hypothetical protein
MESHAQRRPIDSLTSPEIDALMRIAARSGGSGGSRLWYGFSFHEHTAKSRSEDLFAAVKGLFDLLMQICPETQARDAEWSLWLRSDRGKMGTFWALWEPLGKGENAAHEERGESFWQRRYPEPVQWRRLAVAHYDGHIFFTLEERFAFNVNLVSGAFRGVDVGDNDARKLVSWIIKSSEQEVRDVIRNPEEYNQYIEKELPLSKRFGRIRRIDIWNGADEADRLDKQIGSENLAKFERVISRLKDDGVIDTMTLADFLGYCEICYEANEYRQYPSNASPLEKYKTMADGRHDGLLDLPLDDPDAFSDWYRSRSNTGHPFDICGRGNSISISLQVSRRGSAWQLFLAGFNPVRVVETARMAIALYERGVPFGLAMKDEMLQMLTGKDFIGIVPDDIILRFNYDSFSDKDKVYSFAHLWMMSAINDRIVKKIEWRPTPRWSLHT